MRRRSRASAILIRDSIRAALIPTVDSAKTVGLVSLPGNDVRADILPGLIR
ncbi:ABC transporter permease [Escherichia coli]